MEPTSLRVALVPGSNLQLQKCLEPVAATADRGIGRRATVDAPPKFAAANPHEGSVTEVMSPDDMQRNSRWIVPESAKSIAHFAAANLGARARPAPEIDTPNALNLQYDPLRQGPVN